MMFIMGVIVGITGQLVWGAWVVVPMLDELRTQMAKERITNTHLREALKNGKHNQD